MSPGRMSRTKGITFERAVVNAARSMKLTAKRFWGSDGRNAGYAQTVDLLIEHVPLQAKSLKKLPAIFEHLFDDPHVGALVLKENKREPVIVIYLSRFLMLLKKEKDHTMWHGLKDWLVEQIKRTDDPAKKAALKDVFGMMTSVEQNWYTSSEEKHGQMQVLRGPDILEEGE